MNKNRENRESTENISLLRTVLITAATAAAGLFVSNRKPKRNIAVVEETLRADIEDRNERGVAYYFNFRYDSNYKKILVYDFETFVHQINNLVTKQRILSGKNGGATGNKNKFVILTSGIEILKDITITKDKKVTIEGVEYGLDQIYLTLIGKLTFGNQNKKINIFYNGVGSDEETVDEDSEEYSFYKEGYRGLIYTNTSSSYDNKKKNYLNSPRIKNIIVNSINDEMNYIYYIKDEKKKNPIVYRSGSYLIQFKSQYFNISCSENRNKVNVDCGGLCGSRAGGYGGYVVFNCCKNSGEVLDFGGGICAHRAGLDKSSYCLFKKCTNSAKIGKFAGGVCGRFAGGDNGICELINCSNKGDIHGIKAGGLCGYNAGSNYGECKFDKCDNSGKIYGNKSGGLCANLAGSIYGNCSFNNCLNSGDIHGIHAGGLIGFESGIISGNIVIKNKCENNGLLKNILAGQLIGSIEKRSYDPPNSVKISNNTVLLDYPFDNKDNTTNFNGYNDNDLRILGANLTPELLANFQIELTND